FRKGDMGHSANASSVMYATLGTGVASRTLTTQDLNVADTDKDGACGLHAAPPALVGPVGGGSTATGQSGAPAACNAGVDGGCLSGPAPQQSPASGEQTTAPFTQPLTSTTAVAHGDSPVVYGLDGDDTITVNGNIDAVIHGGDDALTGGAGNDVLGGGD